MGGGSGCPGGEDTDVENWDALSDQGLEALTSVLHTPSAVNAQSYQSPYDDQFLERCIEDEVPLEEISGGYRCSIPAIDFLVDLLRSSLLEDFCTVYGSQISGAGLGGCIMVLIKGLDAERKKWLITLIEKAYSAQWGEVPEILLSKPIAGCSIIEMV